MGRFLRVLTSGLAAAVLIANVSLPAYAGDKEDRTDRQVRVFERIMDQMLVDSPNWLVRSSDPTVGYYDEGHGAMFRFRASLVGRRDYGKHSWFSWKDHISVFSSYDDDDDDDDRRSRRSWEERELKAEAKQFPRGKEEVIETLADYGAVLRTLGDAEMVTVQVRLRDAILFDEEDIDRLTFKVSMGDIRAYEDGNLSLEQFANRVSVSER